MKKEINYTVQVEDGCYKHGVFVDYMFAHNFSLTINRLERRVSFAWWDAGKKIKEYQSFLNDIIKNAMQIFKQSIDKEHWPFLDNYKKHFTEHKILRPALKRAGFHSLAYETGPSYIDYLRLGNKEAI